MRFLTIKKYIPRYEVLVDVLYAECRVCMCAYVYVCALMYAIIL